jgi:formate hydrogenlyase subunit 6/NADH:ubiquinone oxidoreductase subunit I
MAYYIDDNCINCGGCVDSCPVAAIAEGENIYVISADLCIDCGACVDLCPTEAIHMK